MGQSLSSCRLCGWATNWADCPPRGGYSGLFQDCLRRLIGIIVLAVALAAANFDVIEPGGRGRCGFGQVRFRRHGGRGGAGDSLLCAVAPLGGDAASGVGTGVLCRGEGSGFEEGSGGLLLGDGVGWNPRFDVLRGRLCGCTGLMCVLAVALDCSRRGDAVDGGGGVVGAERRVGRADGGTIAAGGVVHPAKGAA